MKRLLAAGFVLSSLFLLSANAWAFPIQAGDTVLMTANGDHYGMTVTGVVGDDNDRIGSYHNSFCVEKYETFGDNGNYTYTVESVEDYATGGGGVSHGAVDGRDYLSDQSKWLAWSYWTHKLDAKFSSTDVQNAIWAFEEELTIGTSGDAFELYKMANDADNLTTPGMEFKAINIVYGTNDHQSQLVGAPVPEPATMLLFGMGLIGLAGIGRKRTKE